MKVLFICHRFPYPPVRGGKIRPFNMIRWLSQKHQVTVASIARTPEELEKGKGISPYCHRYQGGVISPQRAWLQALKCVLSSKPSSLGYFYIPQLHAAVKRLLEEESFDLIWVHCSSVAQYVLHHHRCRRIMDFGDMDSEKWYQYARKRPFPLSLVYWLEGFKLRRYERTLARQFGECSVISPAERKTLESYQLGVSVAVIPNGVDLDFFRNEETEYNPKSLVFLGRMDYYPNINGVDYFCHAILPRIRREIPEATITIVGSNPVPRIKELAELPGITVTGEVPDVRPFVAKAAVSVVPLRLASGIQNKVLESMAMKIPVVTSSKAAEGIDAIPGEHFLVDDSVEGFSSKVLSVMKDSKLRWRLAEAGRQRVEARHSWTACLQGLDQLIEQGSQLAGTPLPCSIDSSEVADERS